MCIRDSVVTGNIGTMTVGEFRDSRVEARTINVFGTVKRGTSTGLFANSWVVAQSISSVTVADVATDNDDRLFGITGRVGTLSLPSERVKLRQWSFFISDDFRVVDPSI